jgi:hypothetical protein
MKSFGDWSSGEPADRPARIHEQSCLNRESTDAFEAFTSTTGWMTGMRARVRGKGG